MAIISTIVGALGIEAAKDAAGAADTVLGALFGKRASEVLEEVGARLRGYTDEIPPNHDLERTLRLIQLSTNLYLLRDYQGWDEADRFDTRTATPPPFIAAAHAWLRDQIGLCPRMTVVENAPLVADMERALDALLRSGNPTEAALSRIAAVETAAWDELVAGAGTPPPDFRARFFGRAEGTPGWRDVLRALVCEALKEKPSVKIAFDVSRLSALRDDTAAVGKAAAALSGNIAALQETIAALSRDASETRANTVELMAGQAQMLAMLQQLANKKGVSFAILASILARMGEVEVPEAQMEARLHAKADEYVQLRAELARHKNTLPDAALARARALALLNAGDMSGARRVMGESRSRLKTSREETAREEANLTADEAQIAVLELRYSEAATLFREASNIMSFDLDASWRFLSHSALTLARLGRESGDNNILRAAVSVHEECLRLASKNCYPHNWAMTKNNLGVLLWEIGHRESDSTYLEDGLEALQSALQIWTRLDAPADWAKAKNNIGNIFLSWGEQEASVAKTSMAVKAYTDALEFATPDREPTLWSHINHNLGNSLRTLGERTGSTLYLTNALECYAKALTVRTFEQSPLDWAQTHNNIGHTCLVLGGLARSTAYLKVALSSFQNALQGFRRERVPLDWATAEHNRGTALAMLGEMEDNTQYFQQAVQAFECVLLERRRDRAPSDWALTKMGLGGTLCGLGKRISNTAMLRDSITAYSDALEWYSSEKRPFLRTKALLGLGTAFAAAGTLESNATHHRRAVDSFRAALANLEPNEAPELWTYATQRLKEVELILRSQ